jgi:hypothetical protein
LTEGQIKRRNVTVCNVKGGRDDGGIDEAQAEIALCPKYIESHVENVG